MSADSILLEQIPFPEGTWSAESKQEVTKVVYLVQNGRKSSKCVCLVPLSCSNRVSTIDVALITQITYVRNMRKKKKNLIKCNKHKIFYLFTTGAALK